jgi:5-carboxymethyl-2-hydroxymuconate isomerase
MPHFVQGKYRFEAGKILCVENSRGGEGEGPLVFIKPPTSIIHDDGAIVPGKVNFNLGYGLYLGAAVGKRIVADTRNRMAHILGFGLFLDVYDREQLGMCQQEGLPWDFAKGRDTFCPMSEFVPSNEVHDPYGLEVYLEVNGEEKALTSTRDLVMGLEDSLQFVSERMTIAPGDVIGVLVKGTEGTLYPGDRIEAGISSIGVLRAAVKTP